MIILFLFSIKAIYSVSCQFIRTVAGMFFSWFFSFRTGKISPQSHLNLQWQEKRGLLMPPLEWTLQRYYKKPFVFFKHSSTSHRLTHTFRWFPLEIPHLIQIALSLDCLAVKGLPCPVSPQAYGAEGWGRQHTQAVCMLLLACRGFRALFLCWLWKGTEWCLREFFISLETF